MSLFRKVIVSAALLAAQNTYAADYSLDASTMAVGATAGENLIVKEGCLDPTKTSCTEKFKWLTSTSAIKMGNLQVLGTLSGDFEIVVTADFAGASKAIKLLTADNKGIFLTLNGDSGGRSLQPVGIGEGGGYANMDCCESLPGWKGNYDFNEIKIAVKQGVPRVYTNGVDYGKPISFDVGQKFDRVSIEGITSSDRISDVKVRGISSAVTSCPSTTATSSTNNSGTCTASYSSTTGALIVPCVAVPVTSPFGGVTQTLNYSVQLQQRTGSFAFDLDLNKVQQK